LLSGTEDDVQNIRLGLVTIILDQINESSDSSADKRRLSAQVIDIFSLLGADLKPPIGCFQCLRSSQSMGPL
jgi:hypothetical protein